MIEWIIWGACVAALSGILGALAPSMAQAVRDQEDELRDQEGRDE